MIAVTDFAVTGGDGMPVTLDRWAGQVLLIVNTASKCGFTPQYEGLEVLHRRYGPSGFAVLAFPCNQFREQEPGSADEIARFCSLSYDVTFPLFARIAVNGAEADPLFVHLKTQAPGLLGSTAVKWNFTKFLIDRSGRVVRRYAPVTKPEQLAGDIAALL